MHYICKCWIELGLHIRFGLYVNKVVNYIQCGSGKEIDILGIPIDGIVLVSEVYVGLQHHLNALDGKPRKD